MGRQKMEKGGNITGLAKNSGCFRKRLSKRAKIRLIICWKIRYIIWKIRYADMEVDDYFNKGKLKFCVIAHRIFYFTRQLPILNDSGLIG